MQAAAGTVLAQGGMAASRAAEALRNNIRDEQELYNHFLMAVRSLLTPLQSATAISHVSLLACHAGSSISSKLWMYTCKQIVDLQIICIMQWQH